MINNSETDFTVRRILGLTGPLFVILIYPEIWKNRSYDALEIECTTFYTLRSIYAARLTLFAWVDMALLSAFYAVATLLSRMTLWEMLTQFMPLQCDLLYLLPEPFTASGSILRHFPCFCVSFGLEPGQCSF